MRKPLLLLLVLVAALAGGARPSWGAPAPADKRDAARAKKADAAARLDTLRASDDELEAAVGALDDTVSAQLRVSEAAVSAVRAADASIREAEARLAETERRTARLREALARRAVRSYMRPGGVTVMGVMQSKDLAEASRRQMLIEHASESDAEVLDRLKASRKDELAQRKSLGRARDLSEERRQVEGAKLRELTERRDDQARVKAALDGRISDYVAEVDAFAAEDAALTALINAQAASAAVPRASRTDVPTAGPPALSPAGPTASATAPVAGGGGMMWPTSGPVISGFGMRWGRMHTGIDITAGTGATVVAAKGGTVIQAGGNGAYGNSVIVDHGGGITTLYAHLSSISVSTGQSVGQGQRVGGVGCTGSCSGPHLHFEVRVNGAPQNPMAYL